MHDPQAAHDLLLTLAQVSITYVGFGALVGVVSNRAGTWPLHLRLLLRTLIEVGLLAVLVCIVPAALASTGLTDQALWFVASVVALLCGAAMLGARLYQARRLRRQVSRVASSVLRPLSLTALLVHVLNVLIWREPGPYIAATLLVLGSGAVMFLALLYSLFPLDVGPDSEDRADNAETAAGHDPDAAP